MINYDIWQERLLGLFILFFGCLILFGIVYSDRYSGIYEIYDMRGTKYIVDESLSDLDWFESGGIGFDDKETGRRIILKNDFSIKKIGKRDKWNK